MDPLTFIAKLVEALAWPLAALVAFFVIRRELPSLGRHLRKLRFKDVELEFSEAAKVLATEVREALPEPKNEVTIAHQTRKDLAIRLEAIAELSPRAAILEAWLQVEIAAADVLRGRQLATASSVPSPIRLREALTRLEVLDAKQVEVFELLRRLRNEAAHAPDAVFTNDSIRYYIESALSLAAHLEAQATEA